jgi:hypothetical protein
VPSLRSLRTLCVPFRTPPPICELRSPRALGALPHPSPFSPASRMPALRNPRSVPSVKSVVNSFALGRSVPSLRSLRALCVPFRTPPPICELRSPRALGALPHLSPFSPAGRMPALRNPRSVSSVKSVVNSLRVGRSVPSLRSLRALCVPLRSPPPPISALRTSISARSVSASAYGAGALCTNGALEPRPRHLATARPSATVVSGLCRQ